MVKTPASTNKTQDKDVKKKTGYGSPKASKKAMCIPHGGRIWSPDKKYSQRIDSFDTKVENLVVSVASKPKDTPEGSYTFPMMKRFNDPSLGDEYANEWGIFGFFPRREQESDVEGGGIMRTPPNSKWVWYCFISLKKENQTTDGIGKNIARCFTKFTRNPELSEMSKPESYCFRTAFTQDLKPLNFYLIDEDCTRLLRTLYSHFEKDELMEDDDLMISFFGDKNKGRAILGGFDRDEWEDLMQVQE